MSAPQMKERPASMLRSMFAGLVIALIVKLAFGSRVDAAKAERIPRVTPTPVVQPRGELADLVTAEYPDVRLADMTLSDDTYGSSVLNALGIAGCFGLVSATDLMTLNATFSVSPNTIKIT